MNKLKFYWKSIAWGLVILALLMIRKVPVETPKFEIQGLDKLVHFGLFFILSFLLSRDIKKGDIQKTTFIIVFALPSVYGGVLELVQNFLIEGRSGEWFDFLADACGAFAAWGITKKRQIK